MPSSKELIKTIEKEGRYLSRTVGSHQPFKHPNKRGTGTVPPPKKDIPKGTEKSVLKQAGLK